MGWLRCGRVVQYSVILWAISPWISTVAGAGWVIEQIEYANLGAEETRTLQYISKNRLKMVGDGNTFIMDFAKHLFIAADQEHRVYWSGTVESYMQEVKAYQQAANDQMPSANASSPLLPVAKRPTVTIEPTAEIATIAEQKATKIMVYADGKPYQEVWLAKGLAMKADLDLKRLRDLQARLAQAIMANIPSSQSVEEDPAYTQLLEQGYPVKIVELGEGGEPASVTEVVHIDKRDIPEREFQAPEGYRRIDLREFFREALENMKKGE
jgi:hypothetical protein